MEQLNEKRQLIEKFLEKIFTHAASLGYEVKKLPALKEIALIGAPPWINLIPHMELSAEQQSQLKQYNASYSMIKSDNKNLVLNGELLYDKDEEGWFMGYHLSNLKENQHCNLTELLRRDFPKIDIHTFFFSDSEDFQMKLNDAVTLTISLMSNEWHDYLTGKTWKSLKTFNRDDY